MASKSKHSNDGKAQKGHAGLPPLHLGIALFAVILLVGIAYVFITQASGPVTPNPTATITVTPKPGVNYPLPKAAELTGKASCSNGSRMNVLLFTDPYCPACAANEPVVSKFYRGYKDKADVQFRFVSTHSRSLSPAYGIDEVYQAHDYHVCAQEQDKVDEFTKCFYGQLVIRDGNYIPQNKTMLDACATHVGLDKNRLDACLPDARAKVDAAIIQAAELGGGTYYTPMAVVDCRYRVNSALVQDTYCALSGAC